MLRVVHYKVSGRKETLETLEVKGGAKDGVEVGLQEAEGQARANLILIF